MGFAAAVMYMAGRQVALLPLARGINGYPCFLDTASK